MRILGALYFLSFLAGKLRHFERSFEKLKKKTTGAKNNWRMRIFSASYFSKFFGRKIKNFEQGFGEQKI